MGSRKAIRAYDKDGNQGYVISHSDKIFYPDPNNPMKLTTLTQALGKGQFRFETNTNLKDEDEIGDPVIDPLAKDYIDKVLSSFITEVVTIKSSDWEMNDTLGKYTASVPYLGMKAGVYPSYGLIPTDLLPNELELSEFNRIECCVGQSDNILFVASEYPKTTLNIIIKGLTDYGGLDANLDSIKSEIFLLKEIINENKPQYYNATISASDWSDNLNTITNSNIDNNYIVEVYMDQNITEEQYKALTEASIVAYSVESGAITLKSLGIVPNINIPIILKATLK